MGSPTTQCTPFSQLDSPQTDAPQSSPAQSPPPQSTPPQSEQLPRPTAQPRATKPPEPDGPGDERVRYRLTPKGRAYLAEQQRAAEAALPRLERRRLRARRARAAGRRFGTVCGRFRGSGGPSGRATGRVPDLRLSGHWLRATGFDLGQEFEIETSPGQLLIRAL